MLKILDIFFTILHLALILFNLFAWIFPATRRAHLVTAGLTVFSWLILGIWFGFGYCPITDWQWQVKAKLGETNLPASFIKYFADKILPAPTDPALVEQVTLWTFLVALGCSIYVNFFHSRRARGF